MPLTFAALFAHLGGEKRPKTGAQARSAKQPHRGAVSEGYRAFEKDFCQEKWEGPWIMSAILSGNPILRMDRSGGW